MKAVKQIAAFAAVHFSLTAASLIGAVIIATDAVRKGNAEVGLFGVFLRETTRSLAQPAISIVLPYMEKESIWMWPVLVLNSVIWALILYWLYRVVRIKFMFRSD